MVALRWPLHSRRRAVEAGASIVYGHQLWGPKHNSSDVWHLSSPSRMPYISGDISWCIPCKIFCIAIQCNVPHNIIVCLVLSQHVCIATFDCFFLHCTVPSSDITLIGVAAARREVRIWSPIAWVPTNLHGDYESLFTLITGIKEYHTVSQLVKQQQEVSKQVVVSWQICESSLIFNSIGVCFIGDQLRLSETSR